MPDQGHVPLLEGDMLVAADRCICRQMRAIARNNCIRRLAIPEAGHKRVMPQSMKPSELFCADPQRTAATAPRNRQEKPRRVRPAGVRISPRSADQGRKSLWIRAVTESTFWFLDRGTGHKPLPGGAGSDLIWPGLGPCSVQSATWRYPGADTGTPRRYRGVLVKSYWNAGPHRPEIPVVVTASRATAEAPSR